MSEVSNRQIFRYEAPAHRNNVAIVSAEVANTGNFINLRDKENVGVFDATSDPGGTAIVFAPCRIKNYDDIGIIVDDNPEEWRISETGGSGIFINNASTGSSVTFQDADSPEDIRIMTPAEFEEYRANPERLSELYSQANPERDRIDSDDFNFIGLTITSEGIERD